MLNEQEMKVLDGVFARRREKARQKPRYLQGDDLGYQAVSDACGREIFRNFWMSIWTREDSIWTIVPEKQITGWNRLNSNSVVEAIHIMLTLIKPGNQLDSDIVEALIIARDDLSALRTSTCSACGDKQSDLDPSRMGVEHMRFNAIWGYDSTKDTQRHTLTLCEPCYDKRMLEPLKDLITVTSYLL